MNLTELNRAVSLANDLNTLKNDLAFMRGNKLGVTVNGRYRDDAFVDRVRGAICNEQTRLIALKRAELEELGVEP